MAREEVDAVYIGSNDFWGFDSDTFNEETNFYGRAWVVPQNKATPKMVEDENLSRCQMYYEIGKTDTHLFTPTQIVFDDEQDVVMTIKHIVLAGGAYNGLYTIGVINYLLEENILDLQNVYLNLFFNPSLLIIDFKDCT